MDDETSELAEPQPFTWRDDDNTCFGCGPTNPQGLRLEFWRVGPRAVECHYTPADELNGAPGVLHGGLQAVILDETMGYACHTVAESFDIATLELNLRYRRPVRTGVPLTARAEVVGREGDDLRLEGEIRNADEVLTRATARWKILRSR